MSDQRTATATPIRVAAGNSQRTEALRLANRVRGARAAAKRHIRSAPNTADSRLRASLHIRAYDAELEGMRIDELLSAVRGVGPPKVLALLTAAQVSPWRTLGSLTERQRRLLAFVLAPPGGRSA